MEPKVSIIIPCYNSERFIREALDSALKQTYKNIEVVIINDGSTDDTESIIKTYTDSRIQYVYQSNKGLAGARNTGIQECTGEYVSFLDSDDIYLPEKIERQMEVVEKTPNASVIYCRSAHFFDEDPSRTKYAYVKPTRIETSMKDTLKHGNLINVNTALVKRSVLVDVHYFDERLRSGEDWDLWIRIALKNHTFVEVPDTLVLTRMRKDSLRADLVLQ